MLKKIVFAALVLFCLGLAEDCFADTAAQFEQAAEYKKDGNWQQAEQIYKDIIIANSGDAALVLEAQRGLVEVYVSMKNVADVEFSLDRLISDKKVASVLSLSDVSPEEKNLPAILWYIGNRYEAVGRFEDAKVIYNQTTRRFPDSPQADRAQKAEVPKVDIVLLIQAGKDAEAAIEKLAADLSASEFLPLALHGIAKGYVRSGKYERAREFYERFVKDYKPADRLYALKAQRNLVNLYILMKRDDLAEAAFEKLLTDFAGHPALPRTISDIEEKHYDRIWAARKKGEALDYKSPVKLWEKVMAKFPDFFCDDPYLYYFIADCYRHLGECEKTVDYCKKIVSNWPRYQYMGYVERLMGYCSE